MSQLTPERLTAVFSSRENATLGEYLHWDKIRHLTPPAGLSREQWWLSIKFARAAQLRPLPLTTPTGEPLAFGLPDHVLRLLHYVDQRRSGEIAMPEVVTADDQACQHTS